MRVTTKFLALLPLVLLGAACSGSSPVGPDNPLLGQGFSTVPGGTAEKAFAVCSNVIGVLVKALPSQAPGPVIVVATYVWSGPSVDSCPAPAWDSNPGGILDATKDPFRVRVSGPRPAVVSATAANGVRGEIKLR